MPPRRRARGLARSRLRAREDAASRAVDRARARDVARAIGCAGAAAVGRMIDRATRRATRRVARELGGGGGGGADGALRALRDALAECASRAALPRRADAVAETLRAVTRCGEDLPRAMVPGSVWTLEDGVDGLALARWNARVAAALAEALASVGGMGETTYRALGSVNAFEHADRPTVFGVMEVFQDFASGERSSAVEACLERSGALRDFIAGGFVALAEREDAIDDAMVRRFFAFVLAMLRSKSEKIAAMAFSGVEAAAAPVVSRMCLSRAGTEPNALTLYREITQRALREGERGME